MRTDALMISDFKPTGNRPKGRPAALCQRRYAVEIYGREESAHRGPPLPCYLPPRPLTVQQRLDRLERRVRQQSEDIAELAAAAANQGATR